MSAREQFAGANLGDHVFVCLDCAIYHVVGKGEEIRNQELADKLHAHAGHKKGVWPYKLLSRLADLEMLRANADAKIAYAADASYTITLSGLASDANLLAGQESTGLSNTTNKYLDELVSGKITTGTSPTDAKQIEVHAIGAIEDTPTYPDVFDGTDSAETITSSGIKAAIVATVANILANNTSDRTYPFKPVGIRQLFGDGLPTAHVIFVSHSTGVNLNATASNHDVTHLPVYATVT